MVQVVLGLVAGRASGEPADALRVLLGALVLVGAGTFGVGSLLGLARLMRAQSWIDRWLPAVQRTGVLVWLLFSGALVLSVAQAYGVGSLWGLPGIRATMRILGAALVFLALVRWIRKPWFSGFVNALLGVAAWVSIRRAALIPESGDHGGLRVVMIALLALGAVQTVRLLRRRTAVARDRRVR